MMLDDAAPSVRRGRQEKKTKPKTRLERRHKPFDSGTNTRRKEAIVKGRQQWRNERAQKKRGGVALVECTAVPQDLCSILSIANGAGVPPSEEGAMKLLSASKGQMRASFLYGNQQRAKVEINEMTGNTHTLGVVIQQYAPNPETGVTCPARGFLMSFECLFSRHGSGLVRAEVDGPCYIGEQSVAFHCVRFKAAQIARWLGVNQLNCLDGTCDVETLSMPLWTTKTGPSVGCAFAASFVAAASGLSVDKHTVFTGAIDLRGNILEVGDVVLKAKAAKEAGANRFVCPSENLRKHISPDVLRTAGLEGLEVVGVRSLRDLLTVALLPRGHRQANRSDAPSDDNDGVSTGMYLGSAYTVTTYSDGDAYTCGIKQEIQVMLIEVPGGKGGRILCTGAPPSMPPHVTKCIAFIQSLPHMFKARPGLHVDHLHTPQYDIHVHLPPSIPRNETYLQSTLYLAMISAVTGWVADPQVAIMGEVSLGGLLPAWELLGSIDLQAIHSATVGIKHLIVPQKMLDRCKLFSDTLILGPQHPRISFHGAASILEILDLVFPSRQANPQECTTPPRTERQPSVPSATALDATPAARPGWGLVNGVRQLRAYLPFKF